MARGRHVPKRLLKNMWGFPKIRGTLLGVPYNKDYSILGSILGSPYLGKLPCRWAHIVGVGFRVIGPS